MSYSHANIERLANMIRNDLKLSTPITASALQSAMQKELGIIFQSNTYHRSTVCEIKHPDLNQYIVVYNPKWDKKRQLWNFAQSLGEIILYYCYEDADKHVYTGNLTVYELDQQTKVSSSSLFQTRSHPIETYIKTCKDAEDLENMMKTYFMSKNKSLRFLYNTPSETVLYVESQTPNEQQKQYRLHFEMNQNNKN